MAVKRLSGLLAAARTARTAAEVSHADVSDPESERHTALGAGDSRSSGPRLRLPRLGCPDQVLLARSFMRARPSLGRLLSCTDASVVLRVNLVLASPASSSFGGQTGGRSRVIQKCRSRVLQGDLLHSRLPRLQLRGSARALGGTAW